MKYNKGFDFWKENHEDCNCGSYAFNLDEWYHPGCLCGEDSQDELLDSLECWFAENCDDDELADKLADFYLNRIKDDFVDKITISICEPNVELLDNNVEVIAFRAGVYEFGYYEPDFDYDFHFKVYRDGHWFEKRGFEPVRLTSLDEWSGSIYYNSQTFYITHQIEI